MEKVLEYGVGEFNCTAAYYDLLSKLGLPWVTNPSLEPHAISSRLSSYTILTSELELGVQTRPPSSIARIEIFTLHFLTADGSTRYRELAMSKAELNSKPGYTAVLGEPFSTRTVSAAGQKTRLDLKMVDIAKWIDDMWEMELTFVPVSKLVSLSPNLYAEFPAVWILRDAYVRMCEANLDDAGLARLWNIEPRIDFRLPDINIEVKTKGPFLTRVYNHPDAVPS